MLWNKYIQELLGLIHGWKTALKTEFISVSSGIDASSCLIMMEMCMCEIDYEMTNKKSPLAYSCNA